MTVPTESGMSQRAHDTAVGEPLGPEDLDLDIRFIESGPIVEELMRPTDDGCGRTCESACNSC